MSSAHAHPRIDGNRLEMFMRDCPRGSVFVQTAAAADQGCFVLVSTRYAAARRVISDVNSASARSQSSKA